MKGVFKMNNVKKISAALTGKDAQAIFVTSDQNRYYATGFGSSAGELIICADGSAALFIDARYFEEASRSISEVEVICSNDKPVYELMNDYFKAHNVTKLAVEERWLSYAAYTSLQGKLEPEFTAGQDILRDLRAVKSPEEMEYLVAAQRIADKAFENTLKLITPDITERELAAELTCQMLKLGAQDKSFDPIVVSGSLSSVPHGKPRDVKLQRGFLTMDFGALYKGYCSDTTRTVAIGAPTKEMEKVYSTVLDAQVTAISAAKAGLTGKELDGVARKVIADAGYGEYFTHSLSHGVGIDIHEYPNCSPKSDNVLKVGDVISMEPGIYLPGKFGVRIEDVIEIKEDGCFDLTELPKELLVFCD